MKKNESTLRHEYDLTRLKGGVRGKYTIRYKAGNNLIHLDPDVAKVFESDKSVNEALRSLIKLAKTQMAHSR